MTHQRIKSVLDDYLGYPVSVTSGKSGSTYVSDGKVLLRISSSLCMDSLTAILPMIRDEIVAARREAERGRPAAKVPHSR